MVLDSDPGAVDELKGADGSADRAHKAFAGHDNLSAAAFAKQAYEATVAVATARGISIPKDTSGYEVVGPGVDLPALPLPKKQVRSFFIDYLEYMPQPWAEENDLLTGFR